MKKLAVVFPGQGSQQLGMGREFIETSARARQLLEMAEEASGLELGRLMAEGPMEELTRTVNLQPAMAAVDLICWQAIEQAGLMPVAVAGHSLGEYPALVACGVLEPEDCLRLVSLRGRLMDEAARARPGAMAAIIGPGPEEVGQLCAQVQGLVVPANFNAPTQTVITGEEAAVKAAVALAKQKGYKAIPLRVSGAWHSPLMESAARQMAEAISGVEFAPARCAHVPNTTARPTRDAAEIKAELARQLTSPVRWVQSVQALVELGVEVFVEAGPGKVLAGLVKKCAPQAVVVGVSDPKGVEELVKIVEG